jgi:uncharacterized membrane protein
MPRWRSIHDKLFREAAAREAQLWPTLAILSAAGLYVTLPARFLLGKRAGGAFGDIRWFVLGLTIVLLGALLLTLPRAPRDSMLEEQLYRLHLRRRVLALALIGVLSAANSASIYLLVHVLVNGGKVVATPLLRAAVHLWCVNVLVFGLWFWQIDGGGPDKRATARAGDTRDFLFPQQSDPDVFLEPWEPRFLDYLYVSYTNAAAFSPTDAMPLTRPAKMLMLVESAISLSLGLMVVARAVNILR